MRVFAYIRVSTTRQGLQGSSLQEQRAAIERYAAQHGLEITAWFEEQETAAKSGRRVFRKMMTALKRKQAGGMIIHKIDRSARNLRDWADLSELIDQGVEVHIAHESVDLHSRGGRLMADVQAVIAADYIRNLRDEVLKGFYGRLNQGLYPLAAPVGYLDQGGGKPKIPDPVMGPIVARIFELYASGKYSLLDLADKAYQFGLRSRRGNRLGRNGFSRILNNAFYTGVIHIRSTDERFTGVHEPLISPRLFRDVQDVLHGRMPHKAVTHRHIFRKFIRCASCGYNLTGETQKGHVYYRCHSPKCPPTCIRENVVMDEALQAFAQLRFQPEDYRQFLNEYEHFRMRSANDVDEQVRNARLRLGRIKERLALLTDAYLDQDLERDLFLERKATLIGERCEIEDMLKQLQAGTNPKIEKAEIYFEPIRRLNEGDFERLPGNREEISNLLKSLTSNLTIDEKNLSFNWKNVFLVFFDEEDNSQCGHHRAALRTYGKIIPQAGSPESPLDRAGIKRLAEKIYNELKMGGESMTSRR